MGENEGTINKSLNEVNLTMSQINDEATFSILFDDNNRREQCPITEFSIMPPNSDTISLSSTSLALPIPDAGKSYIRINRQRSYSKVLSPKHGIEESSNGEGMLEAWLESLSMSHMLVPFRKWLANMACKSIKE